MSSDLPPGPLLWHELPTVLYEFILHTDGTFSIPFASIAHLFFGLKAGPDRYPASRLLDAMAEKEGRAFWDSVLESSRKMTPWQWTGRLVLDCQPVWFSAHSFPEAREDGSVLWRGALINHTAERQARAKERRTEERLLAIINGANLQVWEWDAETNEIVWAEGLTDLPDDTGTMLKNPARFAELVHPDDLPRLQRVAAGWFDGSEAGEVVFRICPPGKPQRWLFTKALVNTTQGGEPRRVSGLTIDVTDRVETEHLRSRLLDHTIAAVDQERRRIARELHDEAGQSLTSLLVGLKAVEETITDSIQRHRVSEMRALASSTLDEIGRLASGLHPSALDDFGFRPAVERFVREYARTHGRTTQVDFYGLDTDDRLEPAVELVLYRAIQEAFTNVTKHSHASSVSVVVHRERDQLKLIVEDDGTGFDTERVGKGIGLLSIRERAEILGGTVSLESTPGLGTTVHVRLPVRAELGRSRQWAANPGPVN